MAGLKAGTCKDHLLSLWRFLAEATWAECTKCPGLAHQYHPTTGSSSHPYYTLARTWSGPMIWESPLGASTMPACYIILLAHHFLSCLNVLASTSLSSQIHHHDLYSHHITPWSQHNFSTHSHICLQAQKKSLAQPTSLSTTPRN